MPGKTPKLNFSVLTIRECADDYRSLRSLIGGRKGEKSTRPISVVQEKMLAQILVNSDNHIVLHRRLANFVDMEVSRILSRFNPHLTRVEAHLSDEHAPSPPT